MTAAREIIQKLIDKRRAGGLTLGLGCGRMIGMLRWKRSRVLMSQRKQSWSAPQHFHAPGAMELYDPWKLPWGSNALRLLVRGNV